MIFIGKLDKKIYSCVTGDIKADDVIITHKQVEHIELRHPGDYQRYGKYIAEIIANPDYILRANKPDTAFVLKQISEVNRKFELILRLKTSADPVDNLNSVITFFKVENKRFNRFLRTYKILYKKE